ncbi:MAG: hypothetical protein R3F43_01900 [bacterium]
MVVAPGARKLHIVLAGYEPVVRDVRVNSGRPSRCRPSPSGRKLP